MLPILLAFVVGIAEPCRQGDAVAVSSSYFEAVRQAGGTPLLICRPARTEDLDRILAGVDLLLLPGGEDVAPSLYGESPSPRLGAVNEARDAFERDLLRAAIRQELPIFGTCRGLQHLNVFMGGTLYQDLPSDLGPGYTVVHRADGQCAMHPIEILPGSRLANVCGTTSATVNSLHHQAVKGVAPGMRVTAWTADGVAEAAEATWYPAAGVQFHPEGLSTQEKDPVWVRFYSHLAEFAGRRPTLRPASRPIGVLASDRSGLSLLGRMMALDAFDNATGEEKPDGKPDFSDEDFVCFCDEANGPYERYEAAGKADFLRELVVRGVQFLLGGEGHAPAKAVVAFGDAAMSPGLDAVRAMPRPHDAAVVGVSRADADAALAAFYRSLRRDGLLKPAGAPLAAKRVSAFASVGRDGPLSDEVKYGRGRWCRDLGTRTVPAEEAGLSLQEEWR